MLPALEETGFGVPIAFLGAALEARHKRMALNRQVAGYLVWISLALIGLGVFVLGAAGRNFSAPDAGPGGSFLSLCGDRPEFPEPSAFRELTDLSAI